MIRLEEINENNWRVELSVPERQKAFVSDPMKLLARACAYRKLNSRAYLILEGETPVGMALYHDCPALEAYDLSQLFIDGRYQRRGFGSGAVRLMLEEMRREARYGKAVLCYIRGNDAARALYESLGFRETGSDGDEIIMEKTL